MKNNFRKLLLLFLAIFLTNNSAYSRWKIVYTIDSITSVLYNLQLDKSCKPINKEYNFSNNNRFPNINYDLSKGYNLLKYKTTQIWNNEKKYIWQKKLAKHIQFTRNKTFIYFNIYLNNVLDYSIYFHCNDNNWYQYDIKVNYFGYEVPHEISSDDFLLLKNDKSLTDTVLKSSIFSKEIDEMIICATPIKNKGVEFIINNFVIYNVEWVEKNCHHPFFFDVFGDSSSYYADTCYSLYHLLNTENNIVPEELFRFHISSPIYIKSNDSLDCELNILKKIVFMAIKDYPFYKERNIDRNKIINRYNELILERSDTICFRSYINKLAYFIKKEFHDGHFFIYPPDYKNKAKTSNPIRVFKINSKYQISAILDTAYNSSLSLGDEVVSINKIPIEVIIDSIANEQAGTSERRYRIAESMVLARDKSDSCLLTIINNNVKKNVTIKYNGKINIPKNFISNDFCFKKIDGNISYLRIPDMFNYLSLLVGNYFNEISNSKGLIIDLRGNPGGEMMSGINLFSYFIDKPVTYCHFELFRKNGFDSYIVKPNKKIHFSKNLKIIILGDERTSCSSELFINAMKTLDNVTYIASSRTSGLAMAMYGLIFPSGTIVAIDCLAPKSFFSDDKTIENKGIEPDIWVNRSSIYDLAPYNDKVLKRAKDIIDMNYR